MPIDTPTATTLGQVLQTLRTASNELESLLGGTAPAPDKRIDILQKNSAELGNYDRHYSTTRSALTTLLVTVGLYVANAPVSALLSKTSCAATDILSVMAYLVRNFGVTILLFLLAFPVNLFFRRQTLACNRIQRVIAREIGMVAALPDVPPAPPDIQGLHPPIRGYYFTDDLYRVLQSVKWPRFDWMTRLLLFAVLEFLVIVVVLISSGCNIWPAYVDFLLLAGPLVIVIALSFRGGHD